MTSAASETDTQMTGHSHPRFHFTVVHLERAGNSNEPPGSAGEHYTLVLPLTDGWRLDVEGWEVFPELCTITHTSGHGVTRTGRLTRNADCDWVFDFLEDGVDQPQIADRLADVRFAAGQCISVTRRDGGHKLRIVSLRPF